MPAAGAVYAVAAYCAQYRNPQKNELINGKTDYIGKERKRKIKQTKRLDKQRKREERQSSGSRNFEEMLAYVDENGVLHTTPPEVGEREEIDASQIEVSVPRRSEPEEIVPFEGRVEYFDAAKGTASSGTRTTAKSTFSISRRLRSDCRGQSGDIRTRTRHALG